MIQSESACQTKLKDYKKLHHIKVILFIKVLDSKKRTVKSFLRKKIVVFACSFDKLRINGKIEYLSDIR